jgi:hypothetical protein
VSQAFKHLALLCKGCGQGMDVPETSQEPDQAPIADTIPASTNPSTPLTAANPAVATTVAQADQATDIKEHATSDNAAVIDKPTDINPEVLVQKLPIPETPVPITANSEEPDEPAMKWEPLSIAADALIGLVLLVIGGLLGQVLAKKSTGDVFWDATTAVKFPPIDLMLWLAPPTLLVLIYVLLISRRKSVGGWLQRRSES